MTFYMTKTWGFGAASGPLQFSTRGWLDRARLALKDGDLVVIVGTMGWQTDEGQRGRVIGLMEPTRQVVSCLDYELQAEPQDFDDSGNYRWPFGLELRAAWRFLEPLSSLSNISSRTFNMDAALGIVTLTAGEGARIMALPRVEAPLLRPLKAAAKVDGTDVARRRAAPPPTTRRQGVMHMRRMSAFTYAMEIANASQPAFKIGWSFDHGHRARQFNLASLPKLGGLRYNVKLIQLWKTATEAFRMEQHLLRSFDQLRHEGNREVLTPMTIERLQATWIGYLAARAKPKY